MMGNTPTPVRADDEVTLHYPDRSQRLQQQRQNLRDQIDVLERRRQEREEETRERRERLEQMRGQTARPQTDSNLHIHRPVARPCPEPPQPQQVNLQDLTEALRQTAGRSTVKAPYFDGKSDVRQFIDTFSEVKALNRWGDREAKLQLRMAVPYNVAESLTGDNCEEMLDSLLNRFALSSEEARRELRASRPRRGENIYDYGNHVLKMVKLAYPQLNEEQHKDTAIAELLDSIGDWVLRREFRQQPPVDYPDALRRIHEYNADRGRSESRSIRSLDWNEEQDPWKLAVQTLEKKTEERFKQLDDKMAITSSYVTEKIDKMQTAILSRLENSNAKTDSPQSTKTQQKETRSCNYCKKPGHLWRDCYKRKREEGQQTTNKPTSTQASNSSGPSQQ